MESEDRGGGSKQRHVPEQEGLIFLGSLFPCICLIHCAPFQGLLLQWGHGEVVPSLQDAEKMLSVMWKTLLAAAHHWHLARLLH